MTLARGPIDFLAGQGARVDRNRVQHGQTLDGAWRPVRVGRNADELLLEAEQAHGLGGGSEQRNDPHRGQCRRRVYMPAQTVDRSTPLSTGSRWRLALSNFCTRLGWRAL